MSGGEDGSGSELRACMLALWTGELYVARSVRWVSWAGCCFFGVSSRNFAFTFYYRSKRSNDEFRRVPVSLIHRAYKIDI